MSPVERPQRPRCPRALLPALVATYLVVAIGCSETAPDEPLSLPSRSQFPLVLDALERRCGTLDCHGTPGRNLRLYTGSGLRLDPKDIPGNGQTKDAEYDASYWSVEGLEPEIMSAVVEGEGADPERLIFLRKARGTEHHKPGAIIEEDDDTDVCIRSWLTGKTKETACRAAANFGAPEP